MFRVVRKEFLKKRPDWLVSFLLSVSPTVYRGKAKVDDARKMLLRVKESMNTFGIQGYKNKLAIEETSNSLIIANNKGKYYISFKVQKV